MAVGKCHSLEEFVIEGPAPYCIFGNTLDIGILPGSLASLIVQNVQLKCAAASVSHLTNLGQLQIRAGPQNTIDAAEQVGQVRHRINLSCP